MHKLKNRVIVLILCMVMLFPTTTQAAVDSRVMEGSKIKVSLSVETNDSDKPITLQSTKDSWTATGGNKVDIHNGSRYYLIFNDKTNRFFVIKTKGKNKNIPIPKVYTTLTFLHSLRACISDKEGSANDEKLTGEYIFNHLKIGKWDTGVGGKSTVTVESALKLVADDKSIISEIFADEIKSAGITDTDLLYKDYAKESDISAEVQKFYKSIESNSKYEVVKWLCKSYSKDKSGFPNNNDYSKYDLSKKGELAHFVVYADNHSALSPKAKAEQDKKDQEEALKNSGASVDTLKFDEWCKAMVYVHEGYTAGTKFTKDFTEVTNLPKGFTDYEKAQIFAILSLPDSKQKKDVMQNEPDISKYFKAVHFDNALVGNPKEIMKESLANIMNMSDEAYGDWVIRMLTFEDRMRYLIACAMSGTEVDEYVANFYKDDSIKRILNPDLCYVNIGSGSLIGGPFDVINSTAYVYFLSTVMELYTISRDIPREISSFISSETISQKTLYVKGMYSLYNGLKLIDSKEAWQMWTTPFDSNTESLQSIYEKLSQLGAFEGLDTLTTFNSERPMGTFMDMDSKVLSNLYLKGIAYSAEYMPMNTNVYDPYTIAAYDDEFLEKFHYIYGYHRKALYIDTNATAAVDLHNTGRKGTTRVCTLKDLLKCEKDIVLYIDDNFYNVDELAEMQNKAFERLDNVDEKSEDDKPWYSKLWSKVTDYFSVDIYEECKTAEETKYSTKLRKKIASVKDSEFLAGDADNEDQYVLPTQQIKDYMDGVTVKSTTNTDNTTTTTTVYDSYTPLMAYALVSAVYRDDVFFNMCDQSEVLDPVFISSADLAAITNTSLWEKGSLLNYALLKNLDINVPVGYNYNIDMNLPVYMDIYGNILTESGTVVVPAACNMTLFKEDYCKDLYNMGLFAVYGDDYAIPSDYQNVDQLLEGAFEKDEELEIWKAKSRTIEGDLADYARLATGDRETADAIRQQFEYNLTEGIQLYSFEKFFVICTEVLRGAPIENIRKDFEGLNTDHRVNKAGLVAAAKLEELQKSLKSGSSNSIITLPNLAFMDGLEYFAMFAFKIMTFVVLLIMMITVYIDAVGTQLSLKTFGKCLGIVLLVVCMVITVPTVFQLTYYQSNRSLLQKETAYTAMLNQEKRQSGVEIGIYDVDVPDISTSLLIKLENIDVPWYDVFQEVMFNPTLSTIDEVYAQYADEAGASAEEDVTIMNDGVYMYVDDLLDSSDINVSMTTKNLYMRTDETLTASFYSPYYVILEALISRINEYNTENNWHAFTTKVQKGGRLKTVGLITPYFTSNDFMEVEGDILDMCRIHRVPPSSDLYDTFTDDEIIQMQESLWPNTVLSDEQTFKRLDKLTEYMQQFVSENRILLGKISDETFLEVMALCAAMKHNQLFGVTSADCFEIYNLSNDDLMRLSIANRAQVMSNSTLNFARFVYEVGGMPAVYAAAILQMINWISGFVKPICTILVFIAIFSSLFIFKICMRKESSNLYGYFITTLLLCACNLLHSILLKTFMYMPTLNLPPTVCLIFQALLQLGYMMILCKVTYISFREWRDLGFDKYTSEAQKIKHKFIERKGNHQFESRGRKPKNNWDYYNRLVDTHMSRNGGAIR